MARPCQHWGCGGPVTPRLSRPRTTFLSEDYVVFILSFRIESQRGRTERAYASLFGAAGGIAIVDVPTMTLVGTLPTAGSVSGCGLVNSNDGRTIFLNSAGGTGHFYRLDTWYDTLTEDTSYGPIGIDLHGLAVAANEKTAYITARGVADEIKVLSLRNRREHDRHRPAAWHGRPTRRLGAQGQQPVRHGALLGPGRPDQTPDRQRGVHRCRATSHNRLCGSRDRDTALTDRATSVFDATYAYLVLAAPHRNSQRRSR